MATTHIAEREKSLPLRGRLTTNFGFLLLGRVAAQGLFFLGMVYLARVLLPMAFGKAAFALSVVSYFLLLGDLGSSLLGAREIGSGRVEASRLTDIISLRFWLGLGSFLVLCLLSFSLSPLSQTSILVILFGLLIIPNSLTLDWFLLGLEKMQGVAIVNATRGLVYVVLLVLFVKGPPGLMLVPWFFLAGWFGSACISWYLARRWNPTLSLRLALPSRSWRSLLGSSMPISAYAVLTSSYQSAAILLLGWLRDPEQVALYVAAHRPILVCIYLLQDYAFSILPILCASSRGSRLAATSARVFVYVSVVIALITTLFARLGVTLVYGRAYSEAASPLRILIWSLPAVAAMGVLSMDLIVKARTRPVLAALGMGLAVQIVLSFVLIPKYGARGAALAYVADMVIAAAYLWGGHRKFPLAQGGEA